MITKILARLETPWWKRPSTIVGGVVAVAVASFFLGGAIMGSGGSPGPSTPDPWVQGQTQNSRPAGQQQNNQPVGLTPEQRFQILNKFCTAQAGGPGDLSEAGFHECTNSYYVTDEGMVLPRQVRADVHLIGQYDPEAPI